METDGDASETPPRVVRVWIKSDEDGRVASGARVWERPLPASPEVSLVPGADGTPTDPDASAFDHAAYFDALKTRVYGRTLMTAGTLPSTQTLVQDNASAHPGSLPRGVACVADSQSGGRGRGGNRWTSPPGCLMFSLLARHPDGRTLPFIQYVATMAAVDAIQEAADQALVDAGVAGAGFRRGAGRTVDVRVKWPNDLYCGDAKIGGVLCASTYDDGGFDVVVGVGINLDNAEPTMCVNQIIAERVARAGDGSSSSTATPTATRADARAADGIVRESFRGSGRDASRGGGLRAAGRGVSQTVAAHGPGFDAGGGGRREAEVDRQGDHEDGISARRGRRRRQVRVASGREQSRFLQGTRAEEDAELMRRTAGGLARRKSAEGTVTGAAALATKIDAIFCPIFDDWIRDVNHPAASLPR